MTTGALQTDSRIMSMRAQRTALHHPVVFTPNVESVEIDDERIGEVTKVQSDWREGLRDQATVTDQQLQRGTQRSQKPSAARTTNLGAGERMAKKPVLRSACRVSSVKAERRWEICRTT